LHFVRERATTAVAVVVFRHAAFEIVGVADIEAPLGILQDVDPERDWRMIQAPRVKHSSNRRFEAVLAYSSFGFGIALDELLVIVRKRGGSFPLTAFFDWIPGDVRHRHMTLDSQ
jgi:hypothetical protein